MKKSIFILATLFTLVSCKENGGGASTGNTDQNAKYKQLYEKSVKLKDFHTAITAIQMILLEDSTNDLRDSLPELYGNVNNLAACMAANEGAMKRHPKDERFKSIQVICLQQTGDIEGQFVLLKDLYETTKKAQYLAQIAAIQIATQNYKDANETIDHLIAQHGNTTDKLEVFVDEMNKQDVPVTAAAYNMKGYIYMQQKDLKNAKEAFFKALELYPDFVMPKKNLDAIFGRK